MKYYTCNQIKWQYFLHSIPDDVNLSDVLVTLTDAWLTDPEAGNCHVVEQSEHLHILLVKQQKRY